MSGIKFFLLLVQFSFFLIFVACSNKDYCSEKEIEKDILSLKSSLSKSNIDNLSFSSDSIYFSLDKESSVVKYLLDADPIRIIKIDDFKSIDYLLYDESHNRFECRLKSDISLKFYDYIWVTFRNLIHNYNEDSIEVIQSCDNLIFFKKLAS